MKLTMHNIRSIQTAEIQLDGPLTLIMGRNQSGKTTLLNTVAALVLGERNLYGATAKDAAPVLREGETVASASLEIGDGGSQGDFASGLIWPAYDHQTNGTPPPANEITLGRVDPAGDFKPKDWAAFVRQISGAGKIKNQTILDALIDVGQFGKFEEEIDQTIKILKQGWDVAAKHCEDKRLAARRRWEKATGEKFGTSKADGWTAEGCGGVMPTDDDIDALEVEISTLKAELSRSLAMDEIGAADAEAVREEIKAQADAANKLTGKIEQLKTEEGRIRSELSQYPQSGPLCCPHCQREVELKGGTLTKYVEGQFVRGSDAHNDLVARLEKVSAEYAKLAEEKGTLVAERTANQSVLDAISRAGSGARAADVVKRDIEVAETRYRALTVTREALRAYSEWSFWNSAHELLAPTGLRMQATIAALKELNPRMDLISGDLFPGHDVKFVERDGDVRLLFDWHGYNFLVWNGDPNSYALRINIMLQILEAQRLGSGSFVIIDRFDTLEKQHKNGVMNALLKAEVPAIIGQMVNEKPAKDLLAGAGVGRSYFINDGIVENV